MRRPCLDLALLLLLMISVTGCAHHASKDQVNLEQAAQYNAELGKGYLREGAYEVAMDKFRRALQQDPDLPDAHVGIAQLYARLDQQDLADQHFRKAVRLAPQRSEVLNDYAIYLCDRGQAQVAEKLFLQAAENPNYAAPEVSYTFAGICAQRQNDVAKTKSYLQRALQINPRYPDALWALAKLALAEQNAVQAQDYLRRYHGIVPPNRESLQLAIQIEQRLGNQQAVETYQKRLVTEFGEQRPHEIP